MGNGLEGGRLNKSVTCIPKPTYTEAPRATVNAWLWARTVKCPNPACGSETPLIRSFALSKKDGRQTWIKPVIVQSLNQQSVQFTIEVGKGKIPIGNKDPKRRRSRCLFCGSDNITDATLRKLAKQGGLGCQLLAVVAEGNHNRVYLTPDASKVVEIGVPDADWLAQPLPDNARWFSPPVYGLSTYRDLFTPRQLVALTTLSNLIGETYNWVVADAERSGIESKRARLYADAITTYLACALSRMTDYHCALATWNPTNENISHLFQRQAIPMAWDFAEAHPLEGKLDFSVATRWVAEALKTLPPQCEPANVFQHDATREDSLIGESFAVSTDPPYYSNIGYADLSDFFYVWLRRTLREVDPETFRTVLTPKSAELIASPYRHDGSRDEAESHFRDGFAAVFRNLHRVSDSTLPMTVYYAFKQSEKEADERGDGGGTASTGWETMLDGLVKSGFAVTGTWPVRTTKKARSVARNANALASAIVIVCRKRDPRAQVVSRREFTNALKRELPAAVMILQHESIAPVDLAQASIGPGMAVFTRYAQVLEADGAAMTVRQALIEINRVLDETLAEREGDMDSDTRFCVAWFEQYGTAERAYGEAEVLFTAKNTSFDGLYRAGVIVGGGGRVRLKRRDELEGGWDPTNDDRIADWECAQHLVRAMYAETGGGVSEAARLIVAIGATRAENSRALAYRLFMISERKGWTEEALAYNILVTSWSQIQSEAAKLAAGGLVQSELLL